MYFVKLLSIYFFFFFINISSSEFINIENIEISHDQATKLCARHIFIKKVNTK